MSSQTDPDRQNGLWCEIHDFDQLFLSHNEPDDNDCPERGLPFGASVLLSGPPGSGKTTFALALARSIMIRQVSLYGNRDTDTRFVLFYISPEVSLKRLERNYQEFGWFGDEQEKIDGSRAVWITQNGMEQRPPTFHAITTYPEMDRPVPSPDDQVNFVFSRIAKTITPSEGKSDSNIRYIVIVDSITALLKGCLTPGDERRQTHEILHKFSMAFGPDKLALILMTAEQDQSEDPAQKHSLVEDYLAGFVFRLAHQPLPLGRTTRTLQILKSQGVHMVPGIHTWSIITGDRYDHYIRTVALRNEVFRNSMSWKKEATDENKTLIGPDREETQIVKWGTVVIFARPKLQHPDLLHNPTEGELLSTGTPGLDEILMGDQGYWLRSAGAKHKSNQKRALQRGKITLLAGTVGTGTSRLCLQFLLEDAMDTIKRQFSTKQNKSVDKGDKPGSVLVLLNAKASMVVDETFNEFIQVLSKKHGVDDTSHIERTNYLRILDFTQSNFDFNQLVSHLRWAIKEIKPNRIAFDGLSEYLIRSNSTDASGMLEAISSLILHHPTYTQNKKNNKTKEGAKDERKDEDDKSGPKALPAVMMTYELKMDDDPLAPQSLGVSADNIIAVRQVAVQDQIHKVAYVLKSGNSTSDQNIRELVFREDTGKLEVRSGLDTFNGLLTKDVKKAEVLLQLFGENHSQREFNDWLKNQITRLAKLDFTTLEFSRPVIGRTMEDTHSQTLFPPADLKLMSVDEWWLSYQRPEKGCSSHEKVKDELIDLRRMWDDTEDADLLGPSWQDYLFFELDKAGPVPPPKDKNDKCYFGVPAHMDYGLFCVNAELLRKLKNWKDLPWPDEIIDPSKPDSKIRNLLLDTLPSLWAFRDNSVVGRWFTNGEGSICGIMQEWKNDEKNKEKAFSFDIATRENCVSFFFELAWAFGASEDCLTFAQTGKTEAENAKDYRANAKTLANRQNENKRAMEDALLFLQYLVLEDFMPHRATVGTSLNSLFSRHYYSTLRADVISMSKPKHTATSLPDKSVRPWPRLISMPWFPGGITETTNPDDLTSTARGQEILKRIKNLWERCKDAGAKRLEDFETNAGNAWFNADSPTDLGQTILMTNEILLAMAETATVEEKSSGETTSERKATQADLAIMMRQHLFRLRMLIMDGEDGKAFVKNHEDLLSQACEIVVTGKQIHAPAGYRCSGSWYYGVHSDSSSPSLARELLQEMTSLEASKKMARLGAGIPSRADFFEIYGNEPVPGMDYLSWNQLVTECGATVRRRGRTIAPTVKPAKVHQTIHRVVLDALQRAYLRKKRYGDSKNEIVEIINAETTTAIQRIINSAKETSPSQDASKKPQNF